MSRERLEELERLLPEVPWRRVVWVTVPGVGTRAGCRVCIAEKGLKGAEVEGLPKTAEEFGRHFAETHL